MPDYTIPFWAREDLVALLRYYEEADPEAVIEDCFSLLAEDRDRQTVVLLDAGNNVTVIKRGHPTVIHTWADGTGGGTYIRTYRDKETGDSIYTPIG